MKIIVLTRNISVLVFLFLFSKLSAQTITINFQNIDVKKGGYLYISLFNSEKGYPYLDKVFKTMYVPVSKQEMSVTFENIQPGTYAINVFHDENSNKRMDTNFIRMPVEGYGFSNNPKFFGPPTFNKTKFAFNNKVLILNIRMNY
jgi:uncharacterized protein (DUF2141 family)